jgi:hypothetical protein
MSARHRRTFIVRGDHNGLVSSISGVMLLATGEDPDLPQRAEAINS